MSPSGSSSSQPVVRDLRDFDQQSGSRAERLLFNHRHWIVLICALVTALLSWQATQVKLNASYEEMIPTQHPFIVHYLQRQSDLRGLSNTLRIAVEAKSGTIFDRDYLERLQKINDEVFLWPEVDRAFMKSLWTPVTRWSAVTEEGIDGGPVMPDGYDGSDASLAQLRANLERSTEIGQLVANDYGSSVILLPLLDTLPDGGAPLDYRALSERVETLRAKYDDTFVALHVTGFAKIAGDLIAGVQQVQLFFIVAVLITGAVLLVYTRCLRSTLLVLACSLVAVVWQLGLLPLLGQELDPYSVLVPFLVFAIGMSHGAQKMNGIMQDVGRGTHKLVAARYTFRRLFMAGLTALLCDVVGFAVLMIIQIKAIQDLALIASTGVAVLIFTNLVLLPILLSYIGVSPKAAARSVRAERAEQRVVLWDLLDRFTKRRWAAATLIITALLGVFVWTVSRHLQVGDLDPGAPELRADSRYNRDVAFMTAHYSASSDLFAVMVDTPENQCWQYAPLARVDELQWRLEQLPGVEATQSLANLARLASVGYNEGSLKWRELVPNQAALGQVQSTAPRELFNQSCSLLTLFVYLRDHKAETLTRVVDEVQAFAAQEPPGSPTQFRLAAGNAGIEAATNIVVKQAMRDMLVWIFGAVIALCFLAFGSWRAVVVAVLPLMFTSLLCEALMVGLGIGVKVATLPVIALGVGIGIDYALYVLSVVLAELRRGATLSNAYLEALRFTGKVVMLTGVTLAVGVATWAVSPIKFQADMGILLAAMFLLNMLGALVLLPALGHFLLRPAGASAAAPESVHGGAVETP